MFQTATHTAILEVIDAVISAQGIKALPEAERKPIMRNFSSNHGHFRLINTIDKDSPFGGTGFVLCLESRV